MTQTRRAARPETRQRARPTTKPDQHKRTADAATRSVRVSFQRRHALAGRDIPHLERLVGRPRHDAPPVWKHGNAPDLRRRQIITKVQWTPQRTQLECPRSVATHSPVPMSQTLSVLSSDPETMRRPSGEMATQLTYNAHTSTQKYSGRRNARRSSALSASPRICPSPRPTP